MDNKAGLKFHMVNKQKQVLTESIDASVSGIIITNQQHPSHPIIYCNKAFEELTGYRQSEIIGKNSRFMQGDDRQQRSRFKLQKAIAAGLECQVEIVNYRKNGTLFWNELYIAPIFDDERSISHYIGVLKDITEKKLGGLAHRLEQVQNNQVDQLKADFITTASHELKTPLTSAKASIQLLGRLMDKQPADAKQQSLINQANASLHKLSSLMEDMLGASRQVADRLRHEHNQFQLSAVIQEVIGQFGPAAKQKIKMTGDLYFTITANKDQIKQVVVNILNNAVKYAPDSPYIEIALSQSDQEVNVAITDFGPGISPEIRPYIFNRYYRGKHSMLQISGLGLGLFVAQEIIQAHGGQLAVDSIEGQGSTFRFSLPLS
ncbi:ATP-binding protein [Mucilaginibacter sp. PAMB04274]|uniref:ATP-binding protein n=1 Tax=Mucilaginibacter sp. PAMB04274 TaxID=3138568 RepID=UPI0031F702AB